MLPVYSFVFDNVADVREEMNDNEFMIPLAPLIGCHVHLHNYFMLKVNRDIQYTIFGIKVISRGWNFRSGPLISV